MKLKEITVKKVYGKKLTIKDASGGYDSTDNQAEVTMTFEGEDINAKEANLIVQKAAQDLFDDDYPFVKEGDKK